MIDYSKYEKVNVMEICSNYRSYTSVALDYREEKINECLDKIYAKQCEVIDIKTNILTQGDYDCAVATIIYGKLKPNKK